MKRRPQLTARIVLVPHPLADEHRRAALQLLGRALADQVIATARAEVAARLGVSPETIDREHGQLAEDDFAFLDAPTALDGAA